MKKTNTILITGASGLVGSALVRQLRLAGYTNLLTPTHTELNLLTLAQVSHYFTMHRPKYVFHLAARVGGIYANSHFPAEFIYQNTQMQLNVIHVAHQYGVKKLLLPGSACTYPRHAQQPIAESALLSGAIEPTNIAYAAAKLNGIVAAQSYRKQYGFNVIVPMPTNAYGVGDVFDEKNSHVIPALMQRFHDAKLSQQSEVTIWGTGKPLREFIFTDDLANALLFLMNHYHDGDIINVGTMQEISIANLAITIAEVVGYRGNIQFDATKPDGMPRKCLDSSHLFALGWQPTVNLKDGLTKMYQYHFIKELA